MKAFLKNYRQSPRKVRLVANLLKGKSVDQAIAQLDFLAKRAGDPIAKLIAAAAANAKANFNIERESLMIKELRVDKGIVMKRMMPAAMGSGHPINKRTSHISVLLAEKGPSKKEAKAKTEAPAVKEEKTKTVKAKAVTKTVKAKKVTAKK